MFCNETTYFQPYDHFYQEYFGMIYWLEILRKKKFIENIQPLAGIDVDDILAI